MTNVYRTLFLLASGYYWHKALSASTKAFLEIDLSRVLWDLRVPQNVFMLRFVIYLAKDHIVIKLICRQVYLLCYRRSYCLIQQQSRPCPQGVLLLSRMVSLAMFPGLFSRPAWVLTMCGHLALSLSATKMAQPLTQGRSPLHKACT